MNEPNVAKTLKSRITNSLAGTDWDVLVAVGVENVQYCSGAWNRYARGFLDRPSCVVWPKVGEPVYVTGAELIGGLRSLSFISDFVGYEERGALPPAVIVDTVANVLRDMGLGDKVIGLELLRTSVPFFRRLQELLPDATFVAADDLLRGLRMVKTPDEIVALRDGALRTDEAVGQAFAQVREGQTEEQLAMAIQGNALENGCSVTAILVGSGEGARVLGAPSQRRLTRGDIVRVDVSAVRNGYYSDLGRMAVVGEPTTEQAQAYADHLAFKTRILDFMEPGRRCSEVHAFYLATAKEMRLELFIYPYIGLGHGIGVNNDEYPKLNAGDETPLAVGMVMNVEPDTLGPQGEVFHAEDMILIEDTKPSILTASRDWTELPSIATQGVSK